MRDRPEPAASPGSRDRILERIAAALGGRERIYHPGALGVAAGAGSAVLRFSRRFVANGGEVLRRPYDRTAAGWLTEFLGRVNPPVSSVAVGSEVPRALRPRIAEAAPGAADVGISMALSAVAETGSLVLAATGPRAVQLLPAMHVVWLPQDCVVRTLDDALALVYGRPKRGDGLPASVALHSGPSKSADIARTVVTGVHGPKRCVAVLEGDPPG